MQLPDHRLGVHWIPYHGRNTDMNYIQALRPSSVKLVDPDPERVRQCLSWIDPNGVVVLRDWALSEQKDDLRNNPVATGIRHAEDWYGKLTTGRFAGFDRKRLAICGINEPFVRNDAEIKATVEFTDGQFTGFVAFNFHDLSIARGWSSSVTVIGNIHDKGKDELPESK